MQVDNAETFRSAQRLKQPQRGCNSLRAVLRAVDVQAAGGCKLWEGTMQSQVVHSGREAAQLFVYCALRGSEHLNGSSLRELLQYADKLRLCMWQGCSGLVILLSRLCVDVITLGQREAFRRS